MADQNTLQAGVPDKSWGNEQYIDFATKTYIVPNLVREKFPDLVKLIFETESMDQEEREYWLQIMPIMSEEQIVKFRQILVNERDELAKLDGEYAQEMARIKNKPVKELNAEEMQMRLQNIKKTESQFEQKEAQQESDLLKQLENL